MRTLAKNVSPGNKTLSPGCLSGPALALPRPEMPWNDSSIGWGRQDPPSLDPWVPADRTCSPCLRSTRDWGALQKTPFDISIAHTFNPNEG